MVVPLTWMIEDSLHQEFVSPILTQRLVVLVVRFVDEKLDVIRWNFMQICELMPFDEYFTKLIPYDFSLGSFGICHPSPLPSRPVT